MEPSQQAELPEFTCQHLVELVTRYFEQALTPTELFRFEEHLNWCEACGIYLEQMRHTIRLTGKLSEEQLVPHHKRELLEVFRDWHRHGQA